MHRPTGITVLAILGFIVAAVWVIAGLTAVFAGGAAMLGPAFARVGLAGGVVMLVYAAVVAATSYGLWQLQHWARTATIVLLVLNLIGALIELAGNNLVGGLLTLLVNGFVLWYMFRPEVKAAFTHIAAPPTRMAA
jgi:uncharacterized membrane protein (DUF2068 family)